MSMDESREAPMEAFSLSPKVADLIARKGFPDGANAICYGCMKEREYTTEEVRRVLLKWPMHCNQRIELVSKGPAK
jgi:hypothetical protein